ncbi:hypothetical protein BC831DRAFT_401417 [Entophlyctis helioformis]|nr:hypothetical protein BC831DRAFT_401417 [Entophlyctis helioformis]
MPFLDAYIAHWADLVDRSSPVDVLAPCKIGPRYFLGRPGLLELDDAVRARFRQETLEAVLRAQERERRDEAQLARQCLFCRHVLSNRADLFQHMFEEHSFSIGLPDNLVHVGDFLDTLQRHLTAMECLYCERTFKSNIVLRKHMRKKKHFKINPRNQYYDRYYIINYAEPDATALRDEEEPQEHDDWEDWNDTDAEEPTMCLFDETVHPSPEDAHEHMKQTHSFDLRSIARDHRLRFHDVIRLINYIRSRTCQTTCFSCAAVFDTMDDLGRHVTDRDCGLGIPPKSDALWTDPQLLVPLYENDPLLTLDVLDDGGDGDGNDESGAGSEAGEMDHVHSESGPQFGGIVAQMLNDLDLN